MNSQETEIWAIFGFNCFPTRFYEEGKDFSYVSEDDAMRKIGKCGHFTQIVWRKTTETTKKNK